MPKKLDEIHDAVVRNLKGKINPRTKKPYSESEMWAIAQAQYKKEKKDADIFFIKAPITKFWEEEVDVQKSAGKIEKTKQRFIEVKWDSFAPNKFNAEIQIEAMDRTKLLRDITNVISEYDLNIINASTLRTNKSGLVKFRFIIEISNKYLLLKPNLII